MADKEVEIIKKPHYFEIVMNSTSDVDGKIYLNQEVVVREYAFTPSELTAKQMKMSKDVIPSILSSFDEMSLPLQEEGMKQMADALEADNKEAPKPTGKK